MLSMTVYPIIAMVLWAVALVFTAVLILRLVISYADPNPFGMVGRFGFKIRKLTEKWVYPAARLLAQYRVDTRLAPLITIFLTLVITYFLSSILANTFFVADGLTAGAAAGSIKILAGFLIYGLLSVLVLFIFIRFISSWFVFKPNTFLGFVRRVTDPILLPVQRLIPPVGMFDLSAMVVLIIISLLQSAVLGLLVR